MQLELSPTWDGRDKRVSYMEAFGRLMAGISPWLSLSDDNTPEGKQRSQLHKWALQSYKKRCKSRKPRLSFMGRSYPNISGRRLYCRKLSPCSSSNLGTTGQNNPTTLYRALQKLRTIRPAYNNWLLFRAMTEAFLLFIDEEADHFALTVAMNKLNEWYLSDGWYSDGPEFVLDYYNSYVMHPMFVEILEICQARGFPTPHQSQTCNSTHAKDSISLLKDLSHQKAHTQPSDVL